jgi:hypothetical protein
MAFNPAKTKCMVITNHNQPHPHPDLILNGEVLEKVYKYPQRGLILNDRMTWEDHINAAIIKANKKMGLIWRLRNEMPRYIVENIYTLYIRPQLEYGSIIYSNLTQEQSQRLESCQRMAAVACTGAYRRTNTEDLLHEVGWPTLETRRNYNTLILMYKMSHNMTPPYLRNLLPLRQGRHHQTRHEETFIPIRARTQKYNKSVIPATIRRWNALDSKIRTSPSISRFKLNLKKYMFTTRPEYLSRVRERASIQHTRLRLGVSPLKQHLFSHGIIPSPFCEKCTQGSEETATHYLLKCPAHTVHRQILSYGLRPVIGGHQHQQHTHGN